MFVDEVRVGWQCMRRNWGVSVRGEVSLLGQEARVKSEAYHVVNTF